MISINIYKPGEDIYAFSTPFPVIMPGLSFNQYLIMGNEPILVHTGSVDIAKDLIIELETLLDTKSLAYIFVSHFESDECGGLQSILLRYPNANTICSQVTARQLAGFGIVDRPLVMNPGQILSGEGIELKFISYPSEMHLWEGLLAYETRRGVLFASDLIMQPDAAADEDYTTSSRFLWPDIVGSIDEGKIPSTSGLNLVKSILDTIEPKIIASRHGPVIRLL